MRSFEEIARAVEPIVTPLITPDVIKYHLKDPSDPGKYLIHWKYHLKKAYNNYFALGLDKVQGKRILDISTGAGFFSYICLEDNEVCCTEKPSIDVYRKIHEGLGLNCSYFYINRRELLPIMGYFDVITSFVICWDKIKEKSIKGKKRRRWDSDDYRFLFGDLISHLMPGGRVFLYYPRRSSLGILKSELQKEYGDRIKIARVKNKKCTY